mmetsp:Transcript_2163/g.4652  ORF Transcript_2163/g.4652 Transcript_2163/m.4652 type:complete len:103 (+) Transcript_2163:687-995(+)
MLGRSIAMLLGDGECTASDDDASSDDDGGDDKDQEMTTTTPRSRGHPGARDAASLAIYSRLSLMLGDAPAYTVAGPPLPSHARFSAVSRHTLSPAAPPVRCD